MARRPVVVSLVMALVFIVAVGVVVTTFDEDSPAPSRAGQVFTDVTAVPVAFCNGMVLGHEIRAAGLSWSGYVSGWEPSAAGSANEIRGDLHIIKGGGEPWHSKWDNLWSDGSYGVFVVGGAERATFSSGADIPREISDGLGSLLTADLVAPLRCSVP